MAICGMERGLLERLRAWRLGNWCGALKNGLRSQSPASLKFKVTKCLKIGSDKVSMNSDENPIGVLERLRWAREEEKGRWIKCPKWGKGSPE